MKTSACIPCHNNSAGIGLTVESIRHQTRAPDEIFVVDDGSTDGSADLVSVPVVRLGKNFGRGAARARCMEHARHELVLCCDAGKILAPDFLEKALPWFDDNHVAAVFGRLTQPPPDNAVGRWRGRHLIRENAPPAPVIHGAGLITGGCLLRASAVRAAGGFDPKLRCDEDADLGTRLLAAGWDVISDPALVVVCPASNTLGQVLERYQRWNAPKQGCMSVAAYLRQIVFSIKVMARDDLAARDPLAALISLLSPHYQYWARRRCNRGNGS